MKKILNILLIIIIIFSVSCKKEEPKKKEEVKKNKKVEKKVEQKEKQKEEKKEKVAKVEEIKIKLTKELKNERVVEKQKVSNGVTEVAVNSEYVFFVLKPTDPDFSTDTKIMKMNRKTKKIELFYKYEGKTGIQITDMFLGKDNNLYWKQLGEANKGYFSKQTNSEPFKGINTQDNDFRKALYSSKYEEYVKTMKPAEAIKKVLNKEPNKEVSDKVYVITKDKEKIDSLREYKNYFVFKDDKNVFKYFNPYSKDKEVKVLKKDALDVAVYEDKYAYVKKDKDSKLSFYVLDKKIKTDIKEYSHIILTKDYIGIVKKDKTSVDFINYNTNKAVNVRTQYSENKYLTVKSDNRLVYIHDGKIEITDLDKNEREKAEIKSSGVNMIKNHSSHKIYLVSNETETLIYKIK